MPEPHMKMLWSSVFFDRSLVTAELVQAKLDLARLPGTRSAFLKTLRSFVGLGGIRKEQVSEIQAALPSLRTPALVIWGRHDKLLPVLQADILGRLLPGARMQIYEDCGHMPQFEYPDRFNREVLDFFAELVRDAKRRS